MYIVQQICSFKLISVEVLYKTFFLETISSNKFLETCQSEWKKDHMASTLLKELWGTKEC